MTSGRAAGPPSAMPIRNDGRISTTIESTEVGVGGRVGTTACPERFDLTDPGPSHLPKFRSYR
jgi:hypothetical protein